uniref:RAP domain-containing protein n=1 Tax=Hyaloperonospora arabidopsidis (strain Emoy2) TaxID=559515 RepID=M4B4T1_HYAAE
MLDTVRLPGRRRFAFSAAYPTPIESAVLDATSGKKPMSRLVCGKCNTTLSATKDLVFFRWRNGIHVSNATDESLKNLFPENAVEEDDTNWKKHKMLCIKCNYQVGTLARVFSSDRVLFSAARVAIQMSEAQSPLLSLSGYPSSVLSFAMWSELILIAETQPQLKDLLQIRRVDTIQQHSTDTAKLNRKILMAKDLQELLRVVDENVLELNQYNIRTAIDRAGRFVATRTSRVDLPAVSSSNSSNKSEAPEDELLVVPSPNLSPRLSTKPTALDTKRFWNLIDETEKLVNFGIAAFKTGRALSNLTTALMRLGVGRATILQPVAAQAVFLMQADKPRMSAHEACMVASAIVHLLPRERRRNDWVLDTLQATSKMVISELDGENASVEDKQRAAEVLIPLARSFLFAESFDEALFRRAFREMNSRALNKLNLPPYKLRVLMSKAYQVHLDCELNGRSSDLRLSPALEDECKQAFDAHQRKSKSSSYRLHHLVCTALDELGIANETSYGVETSYHFDVVAPKQRIAIEINQSDCYEVLEPGDEDEEPKTFGFVDLKTRHLKLLGWTVINLHADRFLQHKTLEDRVMYLSMLLEIVTCREWKPTQLNRSGSRSKQASIK